MEKTSIKDQACDLIKTYFGQTTASMYGDFYQDKKDQVIIDSVTELLSELLGEEEAQRIAIQRKFRP